MKTIQRFLLRLLLLALLVLAVILGVRYLTTGKGIKSLFGFSVSRPLVAQPTPMRIQAIRSIGQWEFLSIDDEEIIDTVRRHWLSSDDQLVRIYRGTLRLGVDFRQCSPDWALAYGDTVKVRLPEVRLLDNLFIDEAPQGYASPSRTSHAPPLPHSREHAVGQANSQRPASPLLPLPWFCQCSL